MLVHPYRRISTFLSVFIIIGIFQWQGGQLIPVFPLYEAQKSPELHHYFGLSSR